MPVNGPWRPVVGFAGRYEINAEGFIRVSLNARGGGIVPGRILSRRGKFDTKGYAIVQLHGPAGKQTKKVHRLVALAFLGLARGRQVNHLNGDKADPRAVNLEWCTASENCRHAIRLGLWNTARESASYAKKLTKEKADRIRQAVAAGVPRQTLAEQHGVHVMTIGEIVRREIWQ